MTQSEDKKKPDVCPYCEEEVLDTKSPFCQPCQVDFTCCSGCGKLLGKSVKVCPHCGTETKESD